MRTIPPAERCLLHLGQLREMVGKDPRLRRDLFAHYLEKLPKSGLSEAVGRAKDRRRRTSFHSNRDGASSSRTAFDSTAAVAAKQPARSVAIDGPPDGGDIRTSLRRERIGERRRGTLPNHDSADRMREEGQDTKDDVASRVPHRRQKASGGGRRPAGRTAKRNARDSGAGRSSVSAAAVAVSRTSSSRKRQGGVGGGFRREEGEEEEEQEEQEEEISDEDEQTFVEPPPVPGDVCGVCLGPGGGKGSADLLKCRT